MVRISGLRERSPEGKVGCHEIPGKSGDHTEVVRRIDARARCVDVRRGVRADRADRRHRR
jgi:hypothetical protein